MGATTGRAALVVATTLALTGCPRPGHLGDECTMTRARAEWVGSPAAGRIEGKVTDDAAHAPVGNLAMRLDDSAHVARTAGDGSFRFDQVAEGRHILWNESSVYQPHADTLVVERGRGLHGAIALSPRRDVLTRCWIYNP